MSTAQPTRVLYCYASGREGAWEAICLDLDIAVQGRSFEEVARLLQEAIGLYLETAKDLPEAERAAFLSRPVPFLTRLGFAIEAFWSTLRARADGELEHQLTMALPTPARLSEQALRQARLTDDRCQGLRADVLVACVIGGRDDPVTTIDEALDVSMTALLANQLEAVGDQELLGISKLHERSSARPNAGESR